MDKEDECNTIKILPKAGKVPHRQGAGTHCSHLRILLSETEEVRRRHVEAARRVRQRCNFVFGLKHERDEHDNVFVENPVVGDFLAK